MLFTWNFADRFTNDRPLIVLSVEEEAQFIDTSLPVLLTGIGKVNAAASLAAVLSGGRLPSRIVNLGTAGALRPDRSGLHRIRTVLQRGFDSRLMHKLTREKFGAPIEIMADGATLSTGDDFVSDEATREQLSANAGLCDMEGYAVAATAAAVGLPVELIKHINNKADENAVQDWPKNVAESARILADWAAQNIPGYDA
jgi:adenosylhomocysteine nucleosidase